MSMLVYAYVFAPIVAGALLNGLIFARMSQSRQSSQSRLLPPGWVVGGVWMVLLGLLGYTGYRVRQSPVASWGVWTMVCYCLAYPFLTAGFRAKVQVWNVVAMVLAYLCALGVSAARTREVVWLGPLLAWVSYVGVVGAL